MLARRKGIGLHVRTFLLTPNPFKASGSTSSRHFFQVTSITCRQFDAVKVVDVTEVVAVDVVAADAVAIDVVDVVAYRKYRIQNFVILFF